LINAMTMLAITQITMITCIQIQRRDIRLSGYWARAARPRPPIGAVDDL
jgi:hypothetical protein